ncbi:winged helix-turn-helix domain-containing protein [Peptostreptococcus faecalis]|uniref:winged helix-turn-helix domain-containing protein n=1 Tax=Peptostreptococcus faecalis TaxID=2045015 RepID=UPI001FA82E10|nr:winged helix-turn-helix domain-containing protein [Peptostreptococcus faecalis]
MKKNIKYISMSQNFSKWISKIIKNESDRPEGNEELLLGLEELANGEVSTLMVEMQRDQDTYRESLDDGIYVGDLSIHQRSRKVMLKDEQVNLTPKEFDILYFLAENRGEVFTKEQIYKAVWEDDFLLSDSNIMAFIRKIRKKIEPNPDSPKYLLTIWGVGYKFTDKDSID